MRMGSSRGWMASLAIPVICAAWLTAQEVTQDGGLNSETSRIPEAGRVVESIAPDLPAELLFALQDGRFEEAIAGLERWNEGDELSDSDRAYGALLIGIAQRIAGDTDASRKAIAAGLALDPDGPWASKLRFELASTELTDGQPQRAEELARVEVEALLNPDRKDDLAGIYLEFADQLLEPDEPTANPDPGAAYALLEQARELAKGRALQAKLLYRMGRASQEASDPNRALNNYQEYLRLYQEGEDRYEVRYYLGELQAGSLAQAVQGRLTWSDLARDLEKVEGEAYDEIRARALFGIAETYGLPTPGDVDQLSLGLAALRRYLEAYPNHEKAVLAAYWLGLSAENQGKSESALEAYKTFLSEREFEAITEVAREQLATLRMEVAFRIGLVLQQQERFNEAIDAFRGYLAQYPDGPQSANAQRAILTTELLIAQNHMRNERFEEARESWREFVRENPLDSRVPQILFAIGTSYGTEEKFEEAIAAWETLAGKFPGTEPAGHAQYQIGLILEVEENRPAAAIEQYKKVAVGPWQDRARQRIAVMQSTTMAVITPRAFRSSETPELEITTRNVQSLTFRAYKLDPEDYFRKKLALGGVESLDIGLVAPDAEWTVDVPEFEEYVPLERTYELNEVPVPGVHVVKVSDEEKLQATTLVLGSDLDAILKSSTDQVLAYAQDMTDGSGRGGARVLIAEGAEVILEAETGPDGVLLMDWPEKREPNSRFSFLVVDGPHVAGSGLALPGQVATGLSPRAYFYTDRPAYRPGQEVALRGIVRGVAKGQYSAESGEKYHLEIIDSRGRRILDKDVVLSNFGTFNERLRVDNAAPVGDYRIQLERPGQPTFSGAFQVQAYQLQKVDLRIELPKTVYFRGETVEGNVLAKYQYGTPIAGRSILVNLPDGRILRGKTDDAGSFEFSFETEGFSEEEGFELVAQLPEENVAVSAAGMIAVRGYQIGLNTLRTVFLDDESFELTVNTIDALGEPVGKDLAIEVLKQVRQRGVVAERPVETRELTTDDSSGQGSLSLTIDDDQGGTFVIRASGTDRFGNPILAQRMVTISGAEDENKLRILADHQSFKVGERAEVTLYNRSEPGPALLTWEADRILRYEILNLAEGVNRIAWEANDKQFPNFTLAAARMADAEFHQARIDINLRRDLKVTVEPSAEEVGPGGEFEVLITTRDQLDRPVSAELSLAMVDQALLNLYGDSASPIGPFFYNQRRTGAFSAQATNTFTYAPATEGIATALLEERSREQLQALMDTDRADVLFDDTMSLGLQVQEQQIESDFGRNQRGAVLSKAPALGEVLVPQERTQLMMESGTAATERIRELQQRKSAGVRFEVERGLAKGEVEYSIADERDFSLGDRPRRVLGRDTNEMGGPGGYQALSTRGRESMEMAGLYGGRGGGGEGMLGQMGGQSRGGRVTSRQQYVETAYWNPAIVTDESGTARVTIQAPTALSRYRLTARGVSGADTLAGETNTEILISKDFFVELRTPAILSEGDQAQFLARIHHRGVEGAAQIRLKAYATGGEEVYPKTIELEGDGVEEVLFQSFEVPNAPNIELTLTASVGEIRDEIETTVPVRAWGVQALATASGSAEDDRTIFVELPKGRPYDTPEMLITLAPSTQRLLIELALGQQLNPLARELDDRALQLCLPPSGTTADRASDLLGATAALSHLDRTGGSEAPEATRLTARIRGLAAELVSMQNEDGGWPWIAGSSQQSRPSNRLATAEVLRAIAVVNELGLLSDSTVADRGVTWLGGQFAQVDTSDRDTRAAILFALSVHDVASFEQVNRLNRDRQQLSNPALAYLALTFAELDRPRLAGEVLSVLGARSKLETPKPGDPPQRYWEDDSKLPWFGGTTEVTALAALAYATAQPRSPELGEAIDWLLGHRLGLGWRPYKATGPAIAALGQFFGDAAGSNDDYRIAVTVNDQEVYSAEVESGSSGAAIRVPRRLIDLGGQNRVRFDLEGRGTYGFSVALSGFTRDFGPDQDRRSKSFAVRRRLYLAAEPEFEGKPLPTGFSAAIDPEYFRNQVEQIEFGGRARVEIDAYRTYQRGVANWEREFLVIEETIPAGATLVDGSIQTSATHFEVMDGRLMLYYNPDQNPGSTSYDVFGFIPGSYRSLPTLIRNAYDQGEYHLGNSGSIRVLNPGDRSTDPYRATPDELLGRGRALFEQERYEEAGEPLSELWNTYTLRDDVAREAARMLLTVEIELGNAREIVRYFELLREKAPEIVIPFDEIRVVGRAYRDIGEYERAFLVWRATAEASYLEDARLGELLRAQNRELESIAYLLELWKSYPNTASTETDFFGLSQLVASLATRASDDANLRSQLIDAKVSTKALLGQSIGLVQAFLAQSPDNPIADEASLALVNAFLELENYETVVRLAERYTETFESSRYLDSFRFSAALGEFRLGNYDDAISVAETIATATYREGRQEAPSPNKWQALYILGQIYHARRDARKAVSYYEQVADRFSDASGSIRQLTREELGLDEVTRIHPSALAPIARREVIDQQPGIRLIANLQEDLIPRPEPLGASVDLEYRNIEEAEIKVYPVDLMRLYLTRRNLDGVAGIDLSGITPLIETTVSLGEGTDFDDQERSIPLPLKKEGAYLVMVRGDTLYASGIALVSPLELDVLEEPEAGRIRVTVRDTETGDLLPDVQVRVIGSGNNQFFSGETDLRGVFVAEGVTGQVTAVARRETDQYAFYRGQTPVGAPPEPATPESKSTTPSGDAESLDRNLRQENFMNQMRQIDRLQERYKSVAPGVQVDKAY